MSEILFKKSNICKLDQDWFYKLFVQVLEFSAVPSTHAKDFVWLDNIKIRKSRHTNAMMNGLN